LAQVFEKNAFVQAPATCVESDCDHPCPSLHRAMPEFNQMSQQELNSALRIAVSSALAGISENVRADVREEVRLGLQEFTKNQPFQKVIPSAARPSPAPECLETPSNPLPCMREDSEIPVVQAALVSPPTECLETPSNPLPGLRDESEEPALVSPAPECSENPSNPPSRIWLEDPDCVYSYNRYRVHCEHSAEERMNREDSTNPVAEQTFS